MRIFAAIGIAAVMAVGATGSGFAAVGSNQASEANAHNAAPTETAPSAKQGNQPGSGTSVGPGAGGDTANTPPLGYAKGRGEDSSVGKSR